MNEAGRGHRHSSGGSRDARHGGPWVGGCMTRRGRYRNGREDGGDRQDQGSVGDLHVLFGKGTLKKGSGLAGAGIGTVTSLAFKGCSVSGITVSVTITGKMPLNATTAYNATTKVANMTITKIHVVAARRLADSGLPRSRQSVIGVGDATRAAWLAAAQNADTERLRYCGSAIQGCVIRRHRKGLCERAPSARRCGAAGR
jgi:hypothetical protein